MNVSRPDVLHEVSLDIARGRCTALVGPSGAGKSTLLWIFAGLWTPASGAVVRPPGPGRTSPRIGMVFQQLGLWEHLSVARHLDIVGAAPADRDRLLDRMGLGPLRDRRPDELSGGERQRLAVARALAVAPDWLLLDEPMAHLDGPARHDLFTLLRETIATLDAGVLIATHLAPEAMSLADDLAVLIDGRIVQRGTPETVYREPASLEAALALGPASRFGGRVVRPDDVRFTPDPAGDCRVIRCDYAGSAYLLHVGGGDPAPVVCRSDAAVTPDTRGTLGESARAVAIGPLRCDDRDESEERP